MFFTKKEARNYDNKETERQEKTPYEQINERKDADVLYAAAKELYLDIIEKEIPIKDIAYGRYSFKNDFHGISTLFLRFNRDKVTIRAAEFSNFGHETAELRLISFETFFNDAYADEEAFNFIYKRYFGRNYKLEQKFI